MNSIEDVWRKYFKFCRRQQIGYCCIYFEETIEECLRRNQQRSKYIPENIILEEFDNIQKTKEKYLINYIDLPQVLNDIKELHIQTRDLFAEDWKQKEITHNSLKYDLDNSLWKKLTWFIGVNKEHIKDKKFYQRANLMKKEFFEKAKNDLKERSVEELLVIFEGKLKKCFNAI